MRIGIDARMLGFAPGIGRYIEKLSSELFQLDNKNDYFIFLRNPIFSSFEASHSHVHKVYAPEHWYGVLEQITFPLRLLHKNLDLLFVPQFNVPLFVPCPFVVTIHDVTQLYMPGSFQAKSFLRQLAFHRVFSHAVHKSRAIIAVSKYTKKEIIKNFRVPEKKINVILEGPGLVPAEAETRNPKPQIPNNVLNSKFQIPDSPYILAVGVWRPHKNFVRLLEAFARLRDKNEFSALKLVLAGEEDPRYPNVREHISSLGLYECVIAPGVPEDAELDRWYRGASLVVVPSLFEGFGFVGLEALSRGTPVAAAYAASLPEVLGNAASYFDPKNISNMSAVIERLLVDEDERTRILKEAPAVLSRYSWERAAKETLNVFNKTLNKN